MTKHSDILDIAQENDQTMRDRALAYIQSKVVPIPKSKVCLNCRQKTKNGSRWCDNDCRDDWQKFNKG